MLDFNAAKNDHMACFRSGGKKLFFYSRQKYRALMTFSTQEETVVVGSHVCPDCGRVFTSGAALGGHRRVHTKGSITRVHIPILFINH